MSPHAGQRSIATFWSRGGRRGQSTEARRRRRRPDVEAMESRQLLSTIAEFPTPTPTSRPITMATGPDGNLWFTEFLGNKVGMINPTTHATADFATPTANSGPYWIAAGPDGNLWFTEDLVGKIGMINPTTHATADFATPTANSEPNVITAGPDGNLWFTETNGKVGMINPTTHAISEFTVATTGSILFGIAAGPDGNLWFTDVGKNSVGTINPTTHAITEFAIPTATSSPEDITAGPDGNLWFAEYNGNKIGMINPTTHVITETPLPNANSQPFGITTGPDGNLWFSEVLGNRVGTINPVTKGIVETPVPTAASSPRGLVTGPDGNVWFAESDASKLAAMTPTLSLVVNPEPPGSVAPGAAFGLTVHVNYLTGLPDTHYNGNVTLALLNPGGATLGGTLTVAAKAGVATFTGLSIGQVGQYQIVASTDPTTTATTTPITVATPTPTAPPPTIVAEKMLFLGRGRHKRLVGIELDFSSALDPTRAVSAADYMLTQVSGRRRHPIAQAVANHATYDATGHRVTLAFLGKPKFQRGGQLVVVGVPPGGITGATGVPLDGGNTGHAGDNGTFVIAPKGKGISR